jgi:ABC-type spermidine/putrescine transport system permease subunit II
MIRFLNTQMTIVSAALIAGVLTAPTAAQAQATNFGDIARNINDSVAELPGLVTGIAYLVGIVMGITGIFKLKDHVDNPSQTPLKEGAIRLVAGGALFALPIVYDAMLTTIGTSSRSIRPAMLNRSEFNVR